MIDYDLTDKRFRKWDILPALTPEEFSDLKASIASGEWTGRVLVDENENMLDGHHAYRAFHELGRRPNNIMVVKVGKKPKQEVRRLILVWNLARRHISNTVKRGIIAEQLQLFPAWSNRRHAALLNVDHKTVGEERANWGIPQLKTQGRDGRWRGLPKVACRNTAEANRNAQLLRKLSDNETRTYTPRGLRCKLADERRAAIKDVEPDLDDISIRCCDFRKLAIRAHSADLIWTDAPWAGDLEAIYHDLGRLAKQWLKPRRLLCCYCGNMQKDLANDILRKYLNKVWELTIFVQGDAPFVRFFRPQTQPILILSNGEITPHEWKQRYPTGMLDTFFPGAPEKEFHPHQRTMKETLYWLRAFAKPGQTVVDCFAGGCTTAAACLTLGMKCVTADIDPQTVRIGKHRLASMK